MCLNKTYSIVSKGNNLSDAFTIQNGLKEGDALDMNGTDQLLVYADDVNMLGENTNTIREVTDAILICYSCSQLFEPCHIFEGFIAYH